MLDDNQIDDQDLDLDAGAELESTQPDEPGAEELAYLNELRGKPTLLEKVGLIPKEKYDKAVKAANDNRIQLRTFGERQSTELQDLRRKVEQLSQSPGHQQDQAALSDQILEKWQSETDPDTANHLMQNYLRQVKLEAIDAAKVDRASVIKAAEEGVRKSIAQDTVERQWNDVLAREENADLDRENMFSEFDRNPVSPDEAVFLIRARQSKGGIQGYVKEYGQIISRAPIGATVPPIGRYGGNRGIQNSPNKGRELTKKELLDDYHGGQ